MDSRGAHNYMRIDVPWPTGGMTNPIRLRELLFIAFLSDIFHT